MIILVSQSFLQNQEYFQLQRYCIIFLTFKSALINKYIQIFFLTK